jgi:hypothetical protein
LIGADANGGAIEKMVDLVVVALESCISSVCPYAFYEVGVQSRNGKSIRFLPPVVKGAQLFKKALKRIWRILLAAMVAICSRRKVIMMGEIHTITIDGTSRVKGTASVRWLIVGGDFVSKVTRDHHRRANDEACQWTSRTTRNHNLFDGSDTCDYDLIGNARLDNSPV